MSNKVDGKDNVVEIVLDNDIKLHIYNSDKEFRPDDKHPHCAFCLNGNVAADAASAFYQLVEHIDPSEVNTELDLFAGTGWLSSIARKYLKPKTQIMIDYSEDCIKSLSVNFKDDGVNGVFQADVYDYMEKNKRKYDFIQADFNSFTFRRYLTEPNINNLLTRVFVCSKKYVCVLDSFIYSGARFKNGIKYYENHFGVEFRDYRDYYRYFSRFVSTRYGFKISKVVIWVKKRFAYILFEKGYQGKISVKDTKRILDFKRIK